MRVRSCVLDVVWRSYCHLVGLQEPDLYKNSPVYLAPGGAFVSVGPVVDSVYEFKDALSAYERIMTSRAKGKVVVKVGFSVS